MATEMTPILPPAEAPSGEGRNWLDVRGLATLKSEAGANAAGALHKVAEQFESLFLNMMLKSMRDAKLSEGAFDSDSGKFYQDLYDQQLSVALSSGKGLGIAKMLEKALTPHTPANTGLPSQQPLPPRPLRAASTASGVTEITHPGEVGTAVTTGAGALSASGARASLASNPEEFVEMVLPHAVSAGAALGVSPLVLVAQAALETRWGQHVPSTDEGSSYNLFGIKADPHWGGRRIAKDTVEFEGGVAVRKKEPFRAYDSLEHGFSDFVSFLKGNLRYAGALASGADPARFTAALQKAGYATDPGYAAKINAILGSDTLRRALGSLKIAALSPIS